MRYVSKEFFMIYIILKNNSDLVMTFTHLYSMASEYPVNKDQVFALI